MDAAAIRKTERLLVIFFKRIPPPLVAHINRKFPEAEVTIYHSQKAVPVPRGWSYTHCDVVCMFLTDKKTYGKTRRWFAHLPIFPISRTLESTHINFPLTDLDADHYTVLN